MRMDPDDYPRGFAAHFQPLLDARIRFLENMTPGERACCRAAIEELGRGAVPSAESIQDATDLAPTEVRDVLDRLNRRDALKLDPSGERILALYPFSAVPCNHQVEVRGARLDGM